MKRVPERLPSSALMFSPPSTSGFTDSAGAVVLDSLLTCVAFARGCAWAARLCLEVARRWCQTGRPRPRALLALSPRSASTIPVLR